MTEADDEIKVPSRFERLQEILDSGAGHQAARLLKSLAPAEIAHLLEALPKAQRELVWNLVDKESDGEVLAELSESVRGDLIEEMDSGEILAATGHMDLDDLADLIQELPYTITSQVIQALDEQHRRRLEEVLSYPEDTAGGLMNKDTITIRPEVTLEVVLRYLRRLGEQVPQGTDLLFVINRNDKYLGALRLSDLVTRDLDDTVAEAMSLNYSPFRVTDEADVVVRRFEQLDLLSAPVVDDDGKLAGRITVDDVVDLVREQGEHQYMSSAGLSESEDMFAPVMVSAKGRALWLGVNLLTAFLASWVISRFEATIEQVVALAVLMPIVASMGGVAGTQTLTLTIRGIALGQLSWHNARYLMVKELAVGALNGLLWALVIGTMAGIWFHSGQIALLIGVAICINLLAAAISGTLLPLTLDKLGIDPALSGGVLLTTVTDVVGFLAFLGLATVYLL